jgi:hypothetical protein
VAAIRATEDIQDYGSFRWKMGNETLRLENGTNRNVKAWKFYGAVSEKSAAFEFRDTPFTTSKRPSATYHNATNKPILQ